VSLEIEFGAQYAGNSEMMMTPLFKSPPPLVLRVARTNKKPFKHEA
jgi:hypothetical protein